MAIPVTPDKLPPTHESPGVKIQMLVLDTTVSAGFVNIDGVHHRFIGFKHPVHGELFFHISKEAARAVFANFQEENHA